MDVEKKRIYLCPERREGVSTEEVTRTSFLLGAEPLSALGLDADSCPTACYVDHPV